MLHERHRNLTCEIHHRSPKIHLFFFHGHKRDKFWTSECMLGDVKWGWLPIKLWKRAGNVWVEPPTHLGIRLSDCAQVWTLSAAYFISVPPAREIVSREIMESRDQRVQGNDWDRNWKPWNTWLLHYVIYIFVPFSQCVCSSVRACDHMAVMTTWQFEARD